MIRRLLACLAERRHASHEAVLLRLGVTRSLGIYPADVRPEADES